MLYKCFVFAGQLVQSSFTSIKHKKTHNKRTNTPVVIKVICNEKHHTKYEIGHLTNIKTDHGYIIKNSLITFRSSGYYFFYESVGHRYSVCQTYRVMIEKSPGQGKTVIFRLIALHLGVEGGGGGGAVIAEIFSHHSHQGFIYCCLCQTHVAD